MSYLYNGILLSNKKNKQLINNMDESQIMLRFAGFCVFALKYISYLKICQNNFRLQLISFFFFSWKDFHLTVMSLGAFAIQYYFYTVSKISLICNWASEPTKTDLYLVIFTLGRGSWCPTQNIGVLPVSNSWQALDSSFYNPSSKTVSKRSVSLSLRVPRTG